MKLRRLWLGLVLGGLAVRCAAVTIEEVVADPAHWPTEVTVNSTTRGTIIKDGKPAGAMLVGAGKKLAVTGVAAGGVSGKVGGTTVLVPVDKTDLLSEFSRLKDGGAPAAIAPAPAKPAAPSEASSPVPAASTPSAPSAMQRRLAGKILRFDGNALKPAQATTLGGVKYYGLYYSASWCGPCRQFTPQFIATYRQMKAKYPEFEVVFVSRDHSSSDQRDYVKADNMPWLVLRYEDAMGDPELQRYCGPGIPCLVLVDAQGRVLSDSFDGDNYLGPGHVLQDALHRLGERGY